ncbi:MAG: winged helix-turn-helix transcriptional regulator [Ignavibacteriales bacterium]|jgi:ArsR family transcriptional regulator, arsenate/arsenite/antimonite-responsive transcriptional repressor|nr:winged helix-turn-helix transcriptional regulator [Ignavibacteriales bacterium]MBK7981113.1 winged helix-turn-helix transcriptional regulator [Ignavibacteriota bacterium]
MKDNTKIFKALSDINRLRILKALQSKILCVCEIRELLKLANSTVSQHLKILKESGFIIEQKDGKWVNYQINFKSEDVRINAILSQLDFWINDEKIIIEDKNQISCLDRNIICCN